MCTRVASRCGCWSCCSAVEAATRNSSRASQTTQHSDRKLAQWRQSGLADRDSPQTMRSRIAAMIDPSALQPSKHGGSIAISLVRQMWLFSGPHLASCSRWLDCCPGGSAGDATPAQSPPAAQQPHAAAHTVTPARAPYTRALDATLACAPRCRPSTRAAAAAAAAVLARSTVGCTRPPSPSQAPAPAPATPPPSPPTPRCSRRRTRGDTHSSRSHSSTCSTTSTDMCRGHEHAHLLCSALLTVCKRCAARSKVQDVRSYLHPLVCPLLVCSL